MYYCAGVAGHEAGDVRKFEHYKAAVVFLPPFSKCFFFVDSRGPKKLGMAGFWQGQVWMGVRWDFQGRSAAPMGLPRGGAAN